MACPGMLTPHYMQIITATYVRTYVSKGGTFSHHHCTVHKPFSCECSELTGQRFTTITYVHTYSVCARTHKQLQINTSFQNSCDWKWSNVVCKHDSYQTFFAIWNYASQGIGTDVTCQWIDQTLQPNLGSSSMGPQRMSIPSHTETLKVTRHLL